MTLLVPPADLRLPDEPGDVPMWKIREAIRRAEAEERADDIEDLVLLLQRRLARGWRRSPSAMGAYLTGGVYRRWRYVEFLSRQFVKAATGEQPRQIWNLPSRYGKTLLAQWGITWVLDATEGRARMLLVSYGDILARRNSVGIRAMALQHAEQLRFGLHPSRRQQDQWDTTAGGGLMSSGINGGMYGFGAGGGSWSAALDALVRGGILLDDPYAGWAQAHSPTERRKVRDQFKGVVRNRLDEEEAWIIVVHHRLHEDDISQTLVDDAADETGDAWHHVSLPAIAYDDLPDPLGRAPGEPLEPERFALDAVLARAKGMSSYLANAQEQQRPQAEKGNELLRDWFVLSTASEMPLKPERAITSWDLKLKDREAGDYVVGQAWWAIGDGRWCVDQIRGQYDHATTANAIVLLAVRHPECTRHYVEAAGSADEVLPMLKAPQPGYTVTEDMAVRLGMSTDERNYVERVRRHGMGNVRAEPVTQAAKPVRARVYIAPAAERGNVRLPADAPWADLWLDEMSAFPNGLHDDQVDTASQALKVLAKATGGAGIATAMGAITR